MINQQAVASGHSPVGFINPTVSVLGTKPNYTSCFHDITTGNNTSPGSPTKFYAVSGYDLCTGWGTPAGQNLINALANPEALLITPATGFASIGGAGGPFTIASQSLSLTNAGTNSLTWTLANTSVWLNASPSGGTLTPGGSATAVTVSLNTAASNLLVGNYSATLWFTNLNSGIGQGRQFTLAVISPPTITAQPANQAVLEGSTATFTVAATGGLPLSYQWQDNGTNLTDGRNISGSTSTNLTIKNISSAEVGTYHVIVTNFAGVAASSNASLTITPSAPVIILQPADQSAVVGSTAQFSVSAIGNTPFFYQWTFNGTNIDGATNALLTLTNVQLNQAGNYAVQVSNAYGTTNSSNAGLMVYPPPVYLFFDDFSGPVLNPIWQTNLPNAHCGSFPSGTSLIATYIGAPNFGFETLGTNSVLRMTNTMGPVQRRGWSSSTNFVTSDFHYEARFNTLNQSQTTSIDGFIEIWIMDATNSGRYDIVSPFGGAFGSDLYFFAGSSIDNTYTHSSYSYQNYTWYRLVLKGMPGQNIRASLCNDSGTELIGRTLGHGAAAYGSGFKIVLSQVVGSSGVPYPVDVAVDYVSLTTGFPPAITVQPTNQTVGLGGTTSFSVTVSGTAPLSYQWNFNGTNVPGATDTTLILTNVQLNQAGNYAVLVTDAYGSVLSSNAVLTVLTPPSITTQPTNQTVTAGGTANFGVAASGSGPLSYQWNFNGTNIVGATNTLLTLTNVQWSQAGNYAVLVTNIFGSMLSSNAVLVVIPDHFAWNQIPSTRFVNTPFAVTIQAQNMTNGPFTNFNGTVLLGSTNGIAIIPSISGNFVQGVWTGSVVISQTVAGLVLQAVDGLGHFGLANPINVIELPTLGHKQSGNTMLIFWPVGASGFVLETSSSLMPTAWLPVSDPPFQAGDQYVVPVVMFDTNRFYRLRFSGP